MYRLIQGSILDKKCDLVIIPCDNYGGITRWIEEDLVAYGLPAPNGISKPGDTSFVESPEHFILSSAIGYAASVAIHDVNYQFTSESLHNIAEKIIKYCKDNLLRLVNIPLLGAGNGGLSVQESFEILKSHFKNTPYVTANIFVLSKNVYDMLNESEQQDELSCEYHPRVFISYTGYDSKNKEWVRQLYEKLRNNGVDARVDMYNLKHGQDLAQWMTNEISMADKVLLICDKHYTSKANPRRGGVGFEIMIVQGYMMTDLDTEKFICIMREEGTDTSLPIFMRTRYALNCPEDTINEEKFTELLMSLFDCDKSLPMKGAPQYIKERLHT